MNILERLAAIFSAPETLADLKRRVEKLEDMPARYHAREPKVFIVADDQEKMTVKDKASDDR